MRIQRRRPGAFLSSTIGVMILVSAALASPSPIPPHEIDVSALRLQDAFRELRTDPTALAPQLVLGETYYALGNTPAARYHLETYLQGGPSGPDSLRAAYLHARTLLRTGLRLRATRALRALVRNPAAPAAADHDLALLLREDGFTVEGVMSEMRALEKGGPDPERFREAGFEWKELRRHDQAAAMFATLLASNAQVTADDWFQLAYLAHRTKRLDVARTAYDTCLKLDPGHAEAHYNAALVAEAEERNESATYHLEQVLRLRPQYEPAYFQLGRLFLKQERPLEAASVFRRFLGVSQDSLALAEARELVRNLAGESDGSSIR